MEATCRMSHRIPLAGRARRTDRQTMGATCRPSQRIPLADRARSTDRKLLWAIYRLPRRIPSPSYRIRHSIRAKIEGVGRGHSARSTCRKLIPNTSCEKKHWLTGLYGALASGYADSGISNSDKFNLLASKNRAGNPSLFKTFKQGEAEAVAVHAGAMLAASALTDPQKVELLTSHCAGLAAAVANGATDSVEAFHQSVNTSNLSAANKRMLLNSQ